MVGVGVAVSDADSDFSLRFPSGPFLTILLTIIHIQLHFSKENTLTSPKNYKKTPAAGTAGAYSAIFALFLDAGDILRDVAGGFAGLGDLIDQRVLLGDYGSLRLGGAARSRFRLG